MLFSTFTFWLFFPAVLVLLAANRMALRSVTGQNLILLGASYVFYGWWDWRFLGLIVASTLIDYCAALGMVRAGESPARKRWLHLSIAANLSILGFFKYFGFFSEELRKALTAAQVNADWGTLDIVLPVGISFYTLQTLSYSIDVYYGRAKAERNLLRYAVYVAFFPQLVAGPIERARKLIPQFAKLPPVRWESAYSGVRLIIAGLFLKVVVADNLAPYVDAIWADPQALDGGALVLGMVYFAVQIYADFAGYSSIAIGLAAIMGFRLSTNFATPFLATSISALWRGWNITLTMFFRDYIYAELRPRAKGAPRSEARIALATIVTFFVSGLWHGANWTFILWGTTHGVLLAAERQWRRFTDLPSGWATGVLGWIYTFGIFASLAPLFRSPDIGHAIAMYAHAANEFSLPASQRFGLVFVALSFAVDFLWRGQTRLESGLRLEWMGRGLSTGIGREITETVLFASALILVLVNAATRPEPNAFIYFQF